MTAVQTGLSALDGAGVRWSLMHGCAGGRDVDVLVAPADLDRAIAALERRGLRRVGRRRRSGAFLTGWARFDLMTGFAFGRRGELRMAAARACLTRRRRADGAWLLAPEDEFWALLLHCLLDRGGFADRHRRRLGTLAPAASLSGPVVRALPPGVPIAILLAHARAGRWPALVAVRPLVVRAWWRAAPVAVGAARTRAAVLRTARPLLRAWNRRGASVVLLGPDGAGKSTLAVGIAARSGRPVRLVYMGLWPRSGAPSPGPVGVALRPALVWWRYLGALRHRALGRLVVFDRYVYDAMLPPSPPLVRLKRPYLWLLRRSCPAPDLTVVLDAPGGVMARRCGDRGRAELEAERAHFRRIADRVPRAVRIDSDRPPEVVLADVLAHIGRLHASRRLR